MNLFILRNTIALVALYFAYFETGLVTVIILFIILAGMEAIAYAIRRATKLIIEVGDELFDPKSRGSKFTSRKPER